MVKKSSNLDNVVKERPLLPIERLFASMDRVDHQKLLSTPSSTMPYADAAPASKNPIGSRQTCPSAMQIPIYAVEFGHMEKLYIGQVFSNFSCTFLNPNSFPI